MIGFSKNTYLIACNSYLYLFSLYGRTVVHHVGGGLRGVDDVLRGVDDALRQIARIAHDPLGLCCEAGKEAAHTQHENFLFHDVLVFIVNNPVEYQIPNFRPLVGRFRRMARCVCLVRFSIREPSLLLLIVAKSSSAYGLRPVILTNRASSSRYAFSA